jgi:hypothetical protein
MFILYISLPFDIFSQRFGLFSGDLLYFFTFRHAAAGKIWQPWSLSGLEVFPKQRPEVKRSVGSRIKCACKIKSSIKAMQKTYKIMIMCPTSVLFEKCFPNRIARWFIFRPK